MKKPRMFVLGAISAVGLAGVWSGNATAGPIFLGLGMDASGSISSSEFELQRNGYINVLESLGSDLVANDVWLSINQFSSFSRTELGLTEVTTAGVAEGGNIRTALEDISKLGGGTNIGSSIDALVAEYETMDDDFFDRGIIDISTDGRGTIGTSVDDALAAGINQVNCLGVGSGANCDFIGGTDSFSITVEGFEDFETALTQKIQAEVGINPVPAPATLALFGAGLVALGFGARRNRSTT